MSSAGAIASAKSAADRDSIVDRLHCAAALIAPAGAVVHVNAAWLRVRGEGLLAGPRVGVDAIYEDACASLRPDEPRLVAAVGDALRAILSGRTDELVVNYKNLPGGEDDDGSLLEVDTFTIRVTAIDHAGARHALVTHRRFARELYGPSESEISTQRTIDLELANERLREEQRRQRGILDSIPDIAWLKDAGGRFLAVNKRFVEATGIDQEELVGRGDVDAWPSDLAERYRAHDLAVMTSKTMRRVEEPVVDRTGKRTLVEMVRVPIVNDVGQVIGLVGIARDITERKAAEAIILRSKAELEALVQQRTEELCRVNAQLRADIAERQRAEVERKRLEQELLQAQKLEGIGRLAGGIAHDFNNLLTIILAYGHHSLGKLPSSEPARTHVFEMVSAAQRAAELTKQLLAFARKQVVEPRVIDLNALVLATDGMLRPLLGPDVEVVTLPSARACPVRVDPGQFERILLNLAANARDAMPSGGKLVITTADVTVEAGSALGPSGLEPGEYIKLSVSDDGAGIAADILPNIFDPFFTTKHESGGSGIGLGLATCYGIVKQAGGHILAESTLGDGTVFDIYLPRAAAAASTKSLPPFARETSGDETLLLVEDEPRLRMITAEILREEGYVVLEAESGDEAIAIAKENAIDLLLTDVVMPHMSGKTAAAKVLELQPRTRVLFMSGYAAAIVEKEGRLEEGFAFLAKPFTREGLLARVRELFDERDGARLQTM
ncbi:MAG: response regulator [Polyangiaceae bacterium]|nr:response regulator [Polyangiaceae bacterium]